jgi:hypothetical protein
MARKTGRINRRGPQVWMVRINAGRETYTIFGGRELP